MKKCPLFRPIPQVQQCVISSAEPPSKIENSDSPEPLDDTLNNVSRLNEMSHKLKHPIEYRLLPSPDSTFNVKVLVGDLSAEGSGYSKKAAKNIAAGTIIKLLVAEQEQFDKVLNGITMKEPMFNYVGKLQEILVKRSGMKIAYEFKDPTEKNKAFYSTCTIGNLKTSGTGVSKKDAKQDAASKMLNLLEVEQKTLSQTNTSLSSNKLEPSKDDHVTKTISSDGELPTPQIFPPPKRLPIINKKTSHEEATLRIIPLNSENKLSVSSFVEKISTTPCENDLRSIDFSDVVGRQYEIMLKNLAEKYKFETVYEDDKQCDLLNSKEYQCVLTLGVFPVIVVVGYGKDIFLAKRCAARNALLYLKKLVL